MMKTDEQLIWESYTLMVENIEQFKSQAKKVLNNNNVENAEQIVTDIQSLMDEAKEELPDHQKQYVKNDHLPALAMLYVAEPDFDLISQEYKSYLTIPRMASNNELAKAYSKLIQEIKQKKLFKPSDEKTTLLNSYFSNFVQEVHALYEAPEQKTKKQFLDDSEDTVYEDETVKILLADSRLKCIRYGQPHLCISWTGANNYYWKYRMGRMRPQDNLGMTTYFVTNKETGDTYLVDSMGDEDGPANKYSYNPISPNNDSDITLEALVRKHPELETPIEQGIFKFIPYGEDEKRFEHIDANVESITDPELKTAEDYWMFIEAGKKIDHDEWDKIPKGLLKDALTKYASVGENFNIPDEMKEKMQPSDLANYEKKQLAKIKEYFSGI